MSTPTILFNNAELALAAYANLTVDNTGAQENLAALESTTNGGPGMTVTQATQFASIYTRVIAVGNDTDTGFQATVFADAKR